MSTSDGTSSGRDGSSPQVNANRCGGSHRKMRPWTSPQFSCAWYASGARSSSRDSSALRKCRATSPPAASVIGPPASHSLRLSGSTRCAHTRSIGPGSRRSKRMVSLAIMWPCAFMARVPWAMASGAGRLRRAAGIRVRRVACSRTARTGAANRPHLPAAQRRARTDECGLARCV